MQTGTSFAEVASAGGTITFEGTNCLKFKAKNTWKGTELNRTYYTVHDKEKVIEMT